AEVGVDGGAFHVDDVFLLGFELDLEGAGGGLGQLDVAAVRRGQLRLDGQAVGGDLVDLGIDLDRLAGRDAALADGDGERAAAAVVGDDLDLVDAVLGDGVGDAGLVGVLLVEV